MTINFEFFKELIIKSMLVIYIFSLFILTKNVTTRHFTNFVCTVQCSVHYITQGTN
jgi:hypothetical protein